MDYQSKKVLCPFYIIGDKRSVECEGIITPTCKHSFPTVVDKQKYFQQYCCCKFNHCCYEKKLEEKYFFEVT